MKAAHSKRNEWLCYITLSITLSIYKLRFDSVTRNLTALPLLQIGLYERLMSRCWTVETIIILFLLLVTPSNREGEDYNACVAISLCWAGYFRAKPSCSPPTHLSRERKKKERVMFSSQCLMDLAYESKNLFINVYFHQFHSYHL